MRFHALQVLFAVNASIFHPSAVRKREQTENKAERLRDQQNKIQRELRPPAKKLFRAEEDEASDERAERVRDKIGDVADADRERVLDQLESEADKEADGNPADQAPRAAKEREQESERYEDGSVQKDLLPGNAEICG